ncbi:hypothetical protein ACFQO7_02005 [Catellatospora aurea]|uniref:DUF4232 domain-containing protein n=1 Tax=Catellatospora aurea TaxID=1337874 RepID=A0ABW2GMM2_9ACTN
MDPQTIEDDLRAAMHAGPHPVPGWPDPVARVEHGITRRRRNRSVAAVAAAVLLTGVAFTGTLRSTTPPPTTLATVDATEQAAEPLIERRSPRPDRQPCRLDRVESLEWIVQSAPWGPSTGFALRPNNSERCTLSGTPQLSGTNVATGMSEPITAVSVGPLDDRITRQFPATVDPGEPARIHIRAATTCPEGQNPRSYRALVLTVGTRQLKLPEFRVLTDVCGADVSPWFVEPPLDYAPLNATVQAPTTLRAGQDFTYTVRIDNAFPRDYELRSCPVYRLGLAAEATDTWRRITCAPTSIAAHGSMRFTLRGRVPPDTPPGRHKLTWLAALSDGEAIIADMATDGAVVVIT